MLLVLPHIMIINVNENDYFLEHAVITNSSLCLFLLIPLTIYFVQGS